MKKLIMATALIGFSLSASATKYWKASGGNVSQADSAAFDGCANKVYRNSGRDGLTPDQKKSLMKALLKGEAKNDLNAAKSAIKANDGCTYGADGEAF